MHLDEALENVGQGLIQHYVLGCLSLITLTEGFLSTAMFYIIPRMSCDHNSSWDQLTFAYTPLLSGYCLGALWFGGISDISGRRYTLGFCSTLCFVSCFLASASSLMLFTDAAKFLLGLSLGGIHIGTKAMLFEVVPPCCRGSNVLWISAIAALGSELAIITCHFTLRENITTGILVQLPPWRLLMVVAGLVAILAACLVSVIPVSPRQMLAHQRIVSATIILRKFYSINQSESEESLSIFQLEPFKYTETRIYRRQQCTDYILYCVRCIASYFVSTFKQPRTIASILLFIVHMCLFDGSLILGSLLSEHLFLSKDSQCHLSGGRAINQTTWHVLCSTESSEISNLFYNNIFTGLAALAPLLVIPFFVDYIPRKIIIVASCFFAGGGCFLLNQQLPQLWDHVLTYGVACFHSSAVAVLQLLTLETFPTKFRATAFGMMTLCSRLMLVAVVFASDMRCNVVFHSIGYVFLAAAVISVFIPTKDRKILNE